METTPTIPKDTERKRIINRLKRLEGQVRGLQTMVEGRQGCESVLTQIMAAKSAIGQVSLHIIGYAMKNCLVEEEPTDRQALLRRAFEVFLHYRALASVPDLGIGEVVSTPEQTLGKLQALGARLTDVRAIVESEEDCEAAVTLLGEATAMLNQVGLAVVGHSMERCLHGPENASRDELIDESITVFLKYSGCFR